MPNGGFENLPFLLCRIEVLNVRQRDTLFIALHVATKGGLLPFPAHGMPSPSLVRNPVSNPVPQQKQGKGGKN